VTEKKGKSNSGGIDAGISVDPGYQEKGNESYIDYEYEWQVEHQKYEAAMDMAIRLQADFDNYRKRNLEISRVSRDEATADTVKAFLSVFDAVVSAEMHITDEHTLEGIAIIKREFLSALNSLGITPINALGQAFDPNYHNAIYAESKHKTPPNIVTEEIQKGFIKGDKVVRYSLVKISK